MMVRAVQAGIKSMSGKSAVQAEREGMSGKSAVQAGIKGMSGKSAVQAEREVIDEKKENPAGIKRARKKRSVKGANVPEMIHRTMTSAEISGGPPLAGRSSAGKTAALSVLTGDQSDSGRMKATMRVGLKATHHITLVVAFRLLPWIRIWKP